MSQLHDILKAAVQAKASDVHINVGAPPLQETDAPVVIAELVDCVMVWTASGAGHGNWTSTPPVRPEVLSDCADAAPATPTSTRATEAESTERIMSGNPCGGAEFAHCYARWYEDTARTSSRVK